MSDHDAAPDPMDRAYVEAEALLGDEAARAARRARVLAAVAGEASGPAAAGPHARVGRSWGRGGWLIAASVVGLSVLVATQIGPPMTLRPQPQPAPAPAPAAPALPAAPAPAETAPAAPAATAAKGPAGTPRPAPAAREAFAAKAAAPPPTADVAPAVVPPLPLPPPPAPASQPSASFRAAPAPPAAAPAPPPPPAPPKPAASVEINELVVAPERRATAQAAVNGPAADAQAGRAARLREAAGAGRTDEVVSLLARRVPVDAADDDGETALMKAVQANHPAVAALLRRHGASLDLKNHAGATARDMAAAVGDADLDKALGISR